MNYDHRNRPTSAEKACDPRWQALNLVQTAREILGLRDRDITVLRGLLSLVSAENWTNGKTIFVHASNIVLRERCDGIQERTLRRRLARLVEVNLIHREMSANRKRYVLRDGEGNILVHYGFDLSPLRAFIPKLNDIAAAAQAERDNVYRLRKVLRDRLWKLEMAQQSPNREYFALLRNKTTSTDLQIAISDLEDDLNKISVILQEPVDNFILAHQMSDTDSQIDRHIHNSNKELNEKKQKTITLNNCLELAPEALIYAPYPVQTWDDLNKLSNQLGTALAISADTLANADNEMGVIGRSLAIIGLIQAGGAIKHPVQYFNSLLTKAKKQQLNIEAMFLSLTRKIHHSANYIG